MYLTKQTQPADKHTNKQNKNNKISSTNTQPTCTNVTSRKTKQMRKHKKRSNHTKITKIANTTSRQTYWRKKERINKREGKQASCIQALLLKSSGRCPHPSWWWCCYCCCCHGLSKASIGKDFYFFCQKTICRTLT